MWVDMLPSYERRKRRMERMDPAAYEKLREKVKGPEQLAEEMDRNEELAELALALELEPKLKEELKKDIERIMQDMGLTAVIDSASSLSGSSMQDIEQGKFTVSVDTDPKTNRDQIVLSPEGNVQEKIPMNYSLNEQYVSQFQGKRTDTDS